MSERMKKNFLGSMMKKFHTRENIPEIEDYHLTRRFETGRRIITAIYRIINYWENRYKDLDKERERLEKENINAVSRIGELEELVKQQRKALSEFGQMKILPYSWKERLEQEKLESICHLLLERDSLDMTAIVGFDGRIYKASKNLNKYIGRELNDKDLSALFGNEEGCRFLETLKGISKETHRGEYKILSEEKEENMLISVQPFSFFNEVGYVISISNPATNGSDKRHYANKIFKDISGIVKRFSKKSNKNNY